MLMIVPFFVAFCYANETNVRRTVMIFLTWKYDYAETVKKFIILYENVI